MCSCTCICLYQLLPYNADDTKVENKTLTILFIWTECWQCQRKIWSPGFIIDMNTAFLWRTVGQSIGEEARALSVTVVAMEARNVKRCWWSLGNVKDEDRALAVSNGCYGTLALWEKRLELWLCQKRGWHSEYTSVCLWYLAMLKIARNGHLFFSKLGIEPWLCQYLP